MSKPTRATRPYGPGGGGTHDQELHAAPARNKQMVELWLVDIGCAHDLVSIANIARSGDKLCTLKDP
eukprot:2210530-Heterocapsa_arctica.AAC.1